MQQAFKSMMAYYGNIYTYTMFSCCVKPKQVGREVWIDFNKHGLPFSTTPLKTRIPIDEPSLKDIASFVRQKGFNEAVIYLAEIDPVLEIIMCYRELSNAIIPTRGPIIIRISTSHFHTKKLH